MEESELGHTQPLPVDGFLSPGSMVDHYKVVRLLGRGGFGDVYLARDTKLGRKVALKLLNTSQFSSEETAQRFLFEARATARFNHPHIVAIYGVGEHGGYPFVALEYLEGQTLRDRMRASPPTVRAVMRIGLAVAEALKEAHSRKILHCDLKPENILIPRDGRLRLFDFGLAMPVRGKQPQTTPQVLRSVDTMERWVGARQPSRPPSTPSLTSSVGSISSSSSSFDEVPISSEGEAICGTPEYMAPEQWLQQEPTGATDIWALGAILYELVSGALPYSEPSFVALAIKVCSPDPVPPLPDALEIPDDFRELIAASMRKDPAQRPTASEVVDQLERMVHRRRQFLGESKSPFPGLLPFSERYADFFFGRESETDAFLERLRQVSVAPVVGPSGAGKSSFVEAGVIPRLKEQGSWQVLRMRPGGRPFHTLASRLRGLERGRSLAARRSTYRRQVTKDMLAAADKEPEADSDYLAEDLLATPSLLGMMLQDSAEEQKCSVLLFIDQLEELYTLVDDPLVRRRFMEAICGGSHEAQDPVRVIFTLREDFLGRLAEGSGVREALSQLTVMRSPGKEALREILQKPLEAIGFSYDEPDLVDEMVAAVDGKPACLPLLQFATRKMWDHRDRDRKLLRRSVYAEMGGVEGALADHADGVLQGLSVQQVQVARELLLRLVTPEGTRRILGWGDTLHGLGAEAEEILNRLIQSRLVLVGKGRGNERAEAELELVHESLVRRWYRLARWFDESRDELTLLADLSQAAELWEKRGAHEQEGWQGTALREAEEIARRNENAIPDRVKRFLQVSRAREERLLRRRRGLQVAGVTLLFAVALGAIVFAWALADKQREATRQRDRAEAEEVQARRRFAEAQREAARAALLRDDPYEARAKLRASLEAEDSAQARALWWRLTRNPLVWKKELGAAVYDLAFSPDGRTVAAACQDRTVYLFDLRTHSVRFLRGHKDQVYGVAFSPAGDRLATGTWGGEVGLWEVKSGRLRLLTGHTGKVHGLAFSPDGAWLASSSYDTTVRLWPVRDGGAARILRGHTARTFGVAFAPDGKRVYSASWDGTVRVWDRQSGKTVRVLRGHAGKVFAVAAGPGGRRLATAGADGTVRIWDAATGRSLRVLAAHKGPADSVAFNADGQLLASGGYDGTVQIWDVVTGKRLETLGGHQGWVLRVAFGPKGNVVASVSVDRTLRFWNLAYAPPPVDVAGHGDRVLGLALSPDGTQVASGGWDNAVRLWGVGDGRLQGVLTGHRAGVFSVAYNPDGKSLASGSWDKTVRIWSRPGGALLHILEGHEAEVSTAVFRPDGGLLASGSWDATIRFWDPSTGRATALLKGHDGAVYDLAFSPDGALLASASADQTVRLWSVAGRRQLRVLTGHRGPVYGVSFSADGKTLVSGGGDGTVRLWQAPAWSGRILEQQKGRVYHLALDPRGRWVGTPGSDGIVRLWSLDRGTTTKLVGHHAEVNFVRFTPDGRLAITSSDDGTIRTWEVDTGRPYWRAPLLLPGPPRLFSHRGWRRLDDDAPAAVAAGRWRRAVEQQAVVGAASTDGRLVALITAAPSGPDSAARLQLWEVRGDRLLFERPLPGGGGRDPQILRDGTVALVAGGQARLYDRSGRETRLVDKARALSWDGDRLLVVGDKRVHVFDGSGRPRGDQAVDVGATAAAWVGDWLAVGNRDGNVEVISRRGQHSPNTLKQVPSSAALHLRAGPMKTLVVGYANGLVGIWSLSTGDRLIEVNLHGPVNHLHLERGTLYAATALGDHVALDLRVFTRRYCQLLEQVWKEVDVVWDRGQAVLRPPPEEHRCR